MADLTKPPNLTGGNAIDKPKGIRLGVPALHQRIHKAATAADATDPLTMPNRMALMLDCSGSMSGEAESYERTTTSSKKKIDCLRDAVTTFITTCSLKDTAIAIETFGENDNHSRLALTTFGPILMTTAMGLEAHGCTPMHEAMQFVIKAYSVTRGIIVSDGVADAPSMCKEYALEYKEACIPIDTVHIGMSTSGEELLKEIAELTGGKYIKFTDVSAFSKSFKYLTPAFYAQLTAGNIDAADMGAKELK